MRDLLDRSPGLASALRELQKQPVEIARVPRGLIASGFVDTDDAGQSTLPARVSAALI